ncbi:MAG: cryptochrome/photolyase family protein, partial [Gemmatimonadetes bacterium]|nr:cryptochrome/photolyase family protein [Gemmatimonadota bacterium]
MDSTVELSAVTPEPQSRAGISAFRRELLSRNPDPEGRSWIFVPYDQTSDRIGPLSRMDPADVGVVLVESPQKASLRPYHKQKLALILSNLRHFALEQAARGVAVRHIVSRGSYSDALAPVAAEAGGLTMMRAAERELRLDVARLVADGLIDVVPHEGWLTTPEQFAASQKGPPPWRMDAFYRRVRRESGILMEDGRPVGGKFSFDVDNRQPWPGTPAAPTPPDFPLDPIKAEVLELVQARFETHPGVLVPHALCSTQTDAEALWSWAKTECLPLFGPYEDAMSE